MIDRSKTILSPSRSPPSLSLPIPSSYLPLRLMLMTLGRHPAHKLSWFLSLQRYQNNRDAVLLLERRHVVGGGIIAPLAPFSTNPTLASCSSGPALIQLPLSHAAMPNLSVVQNKPVQNQSISQNAMQYRHQSPSWPSMERSRSLGSKDPCCLGTNRYVPCLTVSQGLLEEPVQSTV